MAATEFEELVENFNFLDDWEERYGYIIELGKALPILSEDRKTPESIVNGCASQVWIEERAINLDGQSTIEFDGDSDALIVKGLIAVLRSLISGERASVVAKMDIPAQLERLDLSSHLSKQRSNGLSAMITRLQSFAADQLDSA